jgi:hypothetical protein
VDLEGAVVTADAMHAQRDHAKFLVEQNNADYVFTVKATSRAPCRPSKACLNKALFPPFHTEEDVPLGVDFGCPP